MKKKILTMSDSKEVAFPIQERSGPFVSTNTVNPEAPPPAKDGKPAKGPVITTGNFEVIGEAAEIKKRKKEAADARAKASEGILGVIEGVNRKDLRTMRGEIPPDEPPAKKKTTEKKIKFDSVKLEKLEDEK